tara:strand:- start:42881 stop:43045 length:165 start_codon:yes stop_codon:yes gene_type:complete
VADQCITVNIGTTSLAPKEQSAEIFLERLLAEADAALYTAKDRGCNRTVYFAAR